MFSHLWKKECDTGNGVEGINIPDTIFHQNKLPSVWYFTGKSGKVLRKSKDKLEHEPILQMFAPKDSNPDEPAGQLYDSISSSQEEELLHEDIRDEENATLGVRYFTKGDTRRVLLERKVCETFLLQKYIKPIQGHNSKRFITAQTCFECIGPPSSSASSGRPTATKRTM